MLKLTGIRLRSFLKTETDAAFLKLESNLLQAFIYEMGKKELLKYAEREKVSINNLARLGLYDLCFSASKSDKYLGQLR